MEIYFLEQGRKEYVKDAVERMQQLQRRIDILFEFVSDNDLREIERRFEETEICQDCRGACDGSECGANKTEKCVEWCEEHEQLMYNKDGLKCSGCLEEKEDS